MDDLDRCVLEALQNEFPLSQAPYDILAHKLKIPVDQILKRLDSLIAKGLIRRMGASLDSRKFGFHSTLAAISIGADMVDTATKVINKFPEVTHSYLRNDPFNIWFTIIAMDRARVRHILDSIRSTLSLEPSELLNLPMKRLFKLDARFKISS